MNPLRAAQPDTGEWLAPNNLSLSGATSNPRLVVDSGGRYHALWEDEIDGFIYASGGSDGWSEPRTVETPFFTRRIFADLRPEDPTPRFSPYLVADNAGRIHAFWTDTVTERAGVLNHSSVPAGSFANYDAWSAPQALETGGISPAVALNDSGLHLAYLRRVDTAERPSGIYYRRLSSPDGGWSEAQQIYASRYLRALAPAEADVSIAAPDGGEIVIAWSDPAREQVFVSRSGSGGTNWQPPFEVDRRATTDATGSVGPGNITVGSAGARPVLTWSAGHEPGRQCSQYYRTLSEDGSTWSLPLTIPGLPACLSTAQFINSSNTLFLLGTINQSGSESEQSPPLAYLLAWDGTRWSDPQQQDQLANLENADTNQPIILHCLSGVGRDDRLSIIGCDRGVGGDIWWTARQVGDTAAWFPPPAVWQGPASIASANGSVGGLKIVSDGVGNSHVLWFETGLPEIYHVRRDDLAWSSAVQVLSATNGPVEAIALASNGQRLFAVFRDDNGLHFAQAAAERPTEWSTPVLLAEGQPDARAASILVTRAGEIIIAFAIPLNEPRGVYLTRSPDLGVTWSEPAQIFSGATANWQAVDQPYLAETGDGQLHVIWSQRSLPPENSPLGLAYSRSGDSGATWSPVVELDEAPAIWSALHSAGDRILHLLWAESENERMVLYHSLSADGGATWGSRAQVGSLDAADLPASTIDPVGRPQVFGLDGNRLQNWTFDGADWRSSESLQTSVAGGGQLAAAADAAGRLVVAYGEPPAGGNESGTLYGMVRPLDLPAEALPTPPPPEPTETPAPTAAPTATPEPTPTIALPTAMPASPLDSVPGAGSRAGTLAIAIIPAGLVVLVVVLLVLRAMRMGGRPR